MREREKEKEGREAGSKWAWREGSQRPVTKGQN